MDQAACRRDFAYIRDTIEAVHPRFLLEPIAEEWAARATALERTVADAGSLLHAAGLLTAWLGDGHTNLELPFEPGICSDCLNLPCRWLGGPGAGYHLVVRRDAGPFRRGDELLCVNTAPVEALFQRVSREIPHESEAMARDRSTGYPYVNDFLLSGFHLRALCGPPPYRLTYVREGESREEVAPLEPYGGCADFSPAEKSFAFCGETALLFLDECTADSETAAFLESFFAQALSRGCRRLVLDLSRNPGGNSAVIAAFLRHLPAERYRMYGMLTREAGGMRQACPRGGLAVNRHDGAVFSGDVLAVVSGRTFSSARTFAVTLGDNGLAKIAGAVMGGVPNSYGLPRRFRTPEGGYRFRVSTSLFLRPDSRRDHEASLPIALPFPLGWDWEEGDRAGCLLRALAAAEKRGRSDGRNRIFAGKPIKERKISPW